MLHSALQEALASSTLHPDLLKVMDYAVFPPGKMFRPRLVEAIAKDLGEVTQDHLHLACAIELHHAYSLVHDDLPAMDNDSMRRGKPSTHMAHGEWKAILAGDGLLIASFNELIKVKSVAQRDILTLFAWATGPKGLILGQFLDLSAGGKAGLQDVIRIHELKTGRLIQVATLGSYLLSNQKPQLKSRIDFLRLGREIGVSFQLLDDLSELTEEVSAHEREINPFLTSPAPAIAELELSIRRLHGTIKKKDLQNLERMLDDYFKKTRENLLKGLSQLEANMKSGSPVASELNVLDKIKGLVNSLTNF